MCARSCNGVELARVGHDSYVLTIRAYGPEPHVDLTLTLDQLRGIDGSAPLLRRFGQIPSATAQRLACDAVLTRFLTDPHGEVLDVGRSCRLTNSALNKAVALMYLQLRLPQLRHPGHFVRDPPHPDRARPSRRHTHRPGSMALRVPHRTTDPRPPQDARETCRAAHPARRPVRSTRHRLTDVRAPRWS